MLFVCLIVCSCALLCCLGLFRCGRSRLFCCVCYLCLGVLSVCFSVCVRFVVVWCVLFVIGCFCLIAFPVVFVVSGGSELFLLFARCFVCCC